MSKPTPGPWKVWTGDVAVMIYQPDEDPHYRNNIANVFRNDPNGNAKRPWEANARLIAAAPSLLSVCEAAHELLYHYDLDQQPNGVRWGNTEQLRKDILDKLWAALSSARGQEA